MIAPRRPRSASRIPLALTIAVVLGGGLVGYTRLTAPPTAAASVLRRVTVALRAVPTDQTLHASYAIQTYSGPARGTVTWTEWARLAPDGSISSATLTLFDARGHMQSRTMLQGAAATTYDAQANTIEQGQVSPLGVPNPLDQAAITQFTQQTQQDAFARTAATVLPRQVLGGHAVNVVHIDRRNLARDIVTLYVDAQSSLVRRITSERVDDNGQIQPAWQEDLLDYQTVPSGSAPADAFTLNAPPTARQILTPDHMPPSGTHDIPLAQALALPGPAPLLTAPPDRLSLSQVAYTGLPSTVIVTYLYTNTNTSGVEELGINVFRWPAGADPGADPHFSAHMPATLTQPRSLTIAGRVVQAQYYSPAPTSHSLLYLQDGAGVRIGAVGMSEQTFFQALGALVDGHSSSARAVGRTRSGRHGEP